MRTEIFKIEHLDIIKPLGGDQVKTWVRSELLKSIKSNNSMAFTVFCGEKVISICGITMLWPGVGEAFTIMCEDIKKYGLSLYKAYKMNINTMIKASNIVRLQATIIVDFDEGVRFIERLGFKRDGIMRKWCPDGKDAYLYSMVKEE